MKFQLNQKGIISSVAILTIGLFLLSLSMISLTGALKETAKNSNNKNGEQAFYTAEAAAREGVYQYINGNSDNGDIPILNGISVKSFQINRLVWPPEVIATAKNDKDYFRKIIYEMNVTSGEAFNHAIFSESKLTLSGNAKVTDPLSSVFINGDITFHGNVNETSIAGNVYSTSDDVDSSHVLPPSEVIKVDNFPSAPKIDLTKYKEMAVAENTLFYKSGSNDVDKYINIDEIKLSDYINNNFNGNINAKIYVESYTGTLSIGSGLTNFIGNITAEGNLTIQDGIYTSGTYNDGVGNTYNLITIYVIGDLLTIKGDTIINGVVIVDCAKDEITEECAKDGETKVTSQPNKSPKINGSLISMGKVTIQSANAEITYNADNIGDLGDILGLDPISAAPPKIINWREE